MMRLGDAYLHWLCLWIGWNRVSTVLVKAIGVCGRAVAVLLLPVVEVELVAACSWLYLIVMEEAFAVILRFFEYVSLMHQYN